MKTDSMLLKRQTRQYGSEDDGLRCNSHLMAIEPSVTALVAQLLTIISRHVVFMWSLNQRKQRRPTARRITVVPADSRYVMRSRVSSIAYYACS
jgi:hypothetical protein